MVFSNIIVTVIIIIIDFSVVYIATDGEIAI